MKRFATAAVAAATALSLSTGAAYAQDPDPNAVHGSSSDEYTAGYVLGAAIKEGLNPGTGVTSSLRNSIDNGKEISSALGSSAKADAANGWKVGTTFEILLGVGIAAVVGLAGVAAANAGLLPTF